MPKKKAASKKPTKKALKKKAAKEKKPASKKKGSKKASPKTPTHEEIAALAYDLYRDRVAKGLPGDSHTDWLAAETKFQS